MEDCCLEPSAPSPLTHSWPLFERDQRFDLGHDFRWSGAALVDPSLDERMLAGRGLGVWECDLADSRLTWSFGVFDLFGLPRGAEVSRDEALGLYAEPSRAALERLRGHAIRHRRGFTLDVELRPADGGERWMRIVAAPVCVDYQPIRLHGFKRDVTDEYR
ncbi:hypothetical protein [Rhizorhabdus dicambivorans]|uniref:Diguanylate cyclase n=1 Tax=Rhizorhabdus dicambivorans TaxID=1850238 RepID=A0A2A4G1I9_9SPHN|nr:hypothetical protein [Rhizorhabdus dicambivorans]ATE63428.1 hypothetical protein CMV14_02620 [Rhizorhabdus dicambivorans]PCE43647.1 hypothetical protein COO09_04940 [Rhizorhabdus dicambivorans]